MRITSFSKIRFSSLIGKRKRAQIYFFRERLMGVPFFCRHINTIK